MFEALFLKEWNEKLGVWAFGVGVLALASLVYVGFPSQKDLHDLLAGGILILYFPFMALILGAGAFEEEFRNNAWAYLLSRPVSRAAVWGIKYLSLLTMLAGLWLVFAVFLWALPGLGTIVRGLGLPVAFQAEINFLPWSLLASLFFLTVAYSLSFLSVKVSNILFAALMTGLALAFVAYGGATVVLGFLRDEWFDRVKWLHAFRWGIIFMGVAVAGASILTLMRADFSQSRKKISSFAKSAAIFLVAAVLLTAAWTALLPRTGSGYLWLNGKSGESVIFTTERGLFRYDPGKDKVTRLARAVEPGFPASSVGDGKIVYVSFDPKKKDNPAAVWIVNSDGTGKKRLFSGEDAKRAFNPWDIALTPDGRRVVIFDRPLNERPSKGPSPFWSVDADGTGLKNHAVDPAMVEGAFKDYLLSFAAWTRSGNAVLVSQMGRRSGLRSKLWLCDLDKNTSRVLFEYFPTGWFAAVSPGGDLLAVPYKAPKNGWTNLGLALFDLKTLEVVRVGVDGDRSINRLTWSPAGDKLAFLVRKETPRGSGAYVLTVVSAPDRKTLASREMTAEERTGLLYDLDWLSDDSRPVLSDPTDRCLRIFGPDLREETRIPFPASLKSPVEIKVSGEKVLVTDDAARSLWRLDLGKKSWKKLY